MLPNNQSYKETVHLHPLETFEASGFDDTEPSNRRIQKRRKEDKKNQERIRQIKQMVKQTFNGARVALEAQAARDEMDAIAHATLRSIERAAATRTHDVQPTSFKTTIKHYTLKDLYPSLFTRFAVWAYASVFKLETTEVKQRWYHSVLPFKVTYIVSGPDYQLEDLNDYYERLKVSGIHYIARLPVAHDEVEVEVVKIDPPDMIHLDLQVSKSNIRFEHSLKNYAFTSNTRTH